MMLDAMRKFFILRHAKSDWEASYGVDHDRPLAQRGRQASDLMGRFLARIEQVPELAVTSSAIRARRTLERAAAAGDWACPIDVDPLLYEGPPDAILTWLGEQDDSIRSLLISSHEPTCSDVASLLIGDANIGFPTAAIARIDIEVHRWSQVATGRGELRWLVSPKLLARSGFE